MAKIMLIGAGGQVGQAFLASPLPPNWQIEAYDHARLDLKDRMAVRHAFLSYGPDLVINAAAIANVDTAERDEETAMRVNFEAPGNLAALCSHSDVPMIHLSTDYVFDGDHETPYLPDDPVNPLNIYGKTKFLGEEAVCQELAWHVVVRISSVFSAFKNNILTKAIDWIDTRDQVLVAADQTMAPTYAGDVVQMIAKIGQDLLNGKPDGFGLFQYCGAPAATRFDFVKTVWEAYKPFATREVQITPSTRAAFADGARRPAYTVMDCAKIEKAYGITQQDWRSGIPQAVAQIVAQRKAKP